MRQIAIVFTLAAMTLLAASCDHNTSREASAYVEAYTGGVITPNSSIKVVLTDDALTAISALSAEKQDKSLRKALTFSPKIPGTLHWSDATTLEYIPSTPLKPGQVYKGTLDMSAFTGSKEKFTFRFMVTGNTATISTGHVIITAAAPDEAKITADITLSEPATTDELRSRLTIKGLKTNELNINGDGTRFTATINRIPRTSKDQRIAITLDGRHTAEAVIPAIGEFRIIEARLIEGNDPCIDIVASDPVADSDMSGLVVLEGVARSYTKVSDNLIRLYYDGRGDAPLRLTVSYALKSTDGAALTQDFNATFTRSEALPEVQIPVKGNILPEHDNLILSFRAANLSAIDVQVIQIYKDNILQFLQINGIDGNSELRRSGRLVYKGTLRLDDDPERDLKKLQDYSIDLSSLFKRDPGAIYRIILSYKKDYSLYGVNPSTLRRPSTSGLTPVDEALWDRPNPYYYYDDIIDWNAYNWADRDDPLKPTYYMVTERFPSVNLLSSNIGLIAKYSDGDRIWVTASDIITTEPLKKTDLTVYNYQLREIGKGRTDSDGMAEIKVSARPFAIVARHGGTTGYLKVNNGEEKSLSRFDVGGTRIENGLKAYIYGERGVWRPGDTLHVTMLLTEKGKNIPDSHPAVMELYTPQGQFYARKIISDALNGFYVYNIPTLPDDPTGIWHAYFKIGTSTFHKSLRIETVKPNRLKINVNPGSRILNAGARTTFTITSSWLTGPAAAGLMTHADMTLTSAGSWFEGFDGYTFLDPTKTFPTAESRIVEARLDALGKATREVVLPQAEDAPGMLRADIVCYVDEQGGDQSLTTMSVPFSPYKAYVGIKLPQDDIETDTGHRFPVTAVDRNGMTLNGRRLEYRIYKIDWSWWWESRAEELDSYVNGNGAELIDSGEIITSRDSAVPFRVDYPEWGRYLIYVRDVESGHAAGGTVVADWPSYRGQSAKNDPQALTMLTFSTDRESYDVGQTATVYVPASAGGNALVSIESASGVLSRTWVKTSTEVTPYKFTVTPDMAPNFYIHITLIQPYRSTANDLPVRMYGVRPVLVNNPSSHLTPVITMPDTVHPEENFTIKVSEKKGKPMTYTLAIVDEGLLDLTAFKTPDPWNTIYAREALGVRTWDLYDAVIGAHAGRLAPMYSIGGDQSIIVNTRKDNRFNPVVQFLGPFSLPNGTATHKIRLPMYVGSVRVMLVAGQDGAFGSADKTVAVKNPLMVLSSLPRQLAPGESLDLPVNVFALDSTVRDVRVSVKVDGPLKVDGSAENRLSFREDGDLITRFALATTGEGTGKVTVTATSGSHKISETTAIEVRNPNLPRTTVTRTRVDKDKTASITFEPAASATLELAGFPAMDFNSVFTDLYSYPYSCTEQLSARGIAILYSIPFLSPANAEKARAIIPDLIGSLYARQLPDGGFVYWPGQTSADTWVSSMAGLFLQEASREGYEVNKDVLDAWTRYQENGTRTYRKSAGDYMVDFVQAYRLYTLAVASRPDAAAMNRLRETSGLMPQARCLLAAAYALTGKADVAEELLSSRDSLITYPASNITYGTSVRDDAIVAEALALSGNVPAAITLASEITKSKGFSTQEAAFIASAMHCLSTVATNSPVKAEVIQTSTTAVETAKSVVSTPIDGKSGRADVRNLSDGPLYATVVTVTTPQAGSEVKAASEGVAIAVSWLSADGETVNPASLPQGTDFKAVITVRNLSKVRDVAHLALSAIIPSGWEIYNKRLAGAAESASYDYNDIRDDRSIWYFDLSAGGSKTFVLDLRAAYAGKYHLPPITCTAMYDSHTSANTASSSVIVTR
ncbi:MAG: alpha-2-macroglobulin [Bacteroidales bacterium]|nr:alpha-2-macroglobulin [Bacteroidales bacterium]